MIEVLLTVVPSLCWLMLRCYRLLQTPAEKLLRQLNVEIPHTPVICIDRLGETSVEFHWDTPSVPDESVFYAVMVNGKDVGTLAQTSVVLSSLRPDALYSLQVLAVNAVSSFMAQSPPVYVRTSHGKGLEAKLTSATRLDMARVPKMPPRAGRTGKTGKKLLSTELSAADVSSLSDEAQMVEFLADLQHELAKTKSDHETLFQAQHAEEARLRLELDACRKQLSEGTDVRAKKDSDLRLLEKQKDSLTFAKLKLSKQLKHLENNRGLCMSKLAELQTRVAKLVEKRQHIQNTAESERNRVTTSVEGLNLEINNYRQKIAEGENTLRDLAAEKKSLVNVTSQLRPLVGHLDAPSQAHSASEDVTSVPIQASQSQQSLLSQQSTQTPVPVQSVPDVGTAGEYFARDGHLTRSGVQMMLRIYSVKPEWEADLGRELEVLHGLDTAWCSQFRDALAEYVALYNAAELAHARADSSYEPQKISELQASVSFIGHTDTLMRAGKRKVPLAVEGSLSPSPPPPPPAYSALYHGEKSPEFMQATLTPSSLPASMVALHAPGGFVASPNTSFADTDPSEASGWLHAQTYPSLENQLHSHPLEVGQYTGMDAAGTHEQWTFGNDALPPELTLQSSARAVNSRMDQAPSQMPSQRSDHFLGNSFPRVFDSFENEVQATGHGGLPTPFYGHTDPTSLQNSTQNLSQSLDQNYQGNPDKVLSNLYLQNAQHGSTSESLRATPHHLASEISGFSPGYAQSLGQNTGVGQNMSQNVDQNTSQAFLGDFSDQPVFAPDIQQPIPTTAVSHYAHDIRQNFPYGDTNYQSSPVPDHNYLASQVQAHMQTGGPGLAPSLWNNSSQGSFLDRSRLQDYALQPTAEPLHPSVSQQSNLSSDSGLINSILLPSTAQYGTSNSIWSDRYMGAGFNHNRTVSGGSQLWKNDGARREKSPPTAFVSEFLPFSSNTLPSQNGKANPDDSAGFDIRSM